MKALIASLAVAFVLAACSPQKGPNDGVSAARKESASAKAGWKKVETSGVEISIPEAWTTFDLTKKDFDNAVDTMAKGDSSAQRFAQMAKQMAASGMIKLLAFDTKSVTPTFASNLNLVVLDARNVTMDKLLDLNKQQMQSLAAPGTSIQSSKTTIPAGEAGRLQCTVNLPNQAPYTTNTYLLLHNDKQYLFTFSSLPDKAAEFDKVAMEAMETVRFTN